MFRTYYDVKKYKSDSCEFTAYFETKEEAVKYAEKLTKENPDNYTYGMRSYPDGSMTMTWTGDIHDVSVSDFAWATDYRANGGVDFHTEEGICTRFDTHAALNEYIKRTQQR